MKHKTTDLNGALLDMAVALAQWSGATKVKIEGGGAYILVPYDDGSQINSGRTEWLYFAPSSQWKDGGPIIEHEKLMIQPLLRGGDWYGDWRAVCLSWEGQQHADAVAPTPLVAAMRAYVASKLGDEVELP